MRKNHMNDMQQEYERQRRLDAEIAAACEYMRREAARQESERRAEKRSNRKRKAKR